MFAASKTKQVAAAGTSDPYFPYVPLLLETTSTNGQQNNTFLDSSTNNFTITRNGTPTQGSVTPYWPNGYWGNYFNGSTDYLTVTDNVVLQPGSGDFTFEAWVYLLSLPSASNYKTFWAQRSTTAGFGGAAIVIDSTGAIQYFISNSGATAWQITGGSTGFSVTLNSWQHIALTRSGNTLTFYKNGVAGTTATVATGAIGTSGNFSLMAGAADGAQKVDGYMSNFRMVKGTAVYTAAFTPPTTPLTAITNTSLLTCQSNRFRDNSTNNFAITVNGTPRVQAFQPFSPTASYTTALYGGSGYFGGSSSLTAAYNAAFDLAAVDFTIETWAQTTDSSSNYPAMVGRWQSSGNACWDFRPRSIDIGNFFCFVYSTNGTAATIVNSSTSISDGAWHHLVAVRSGNNFALFVDGVRKATANFSGVTIFNSASAPLNVGYDPFGATYYTGYLSNTRVVKGTAVYDPTLTTLTVPTAPVTAITNTSLLTNFTNAGIYDAAVQNNAITVGDAQSSTTQYKWSPTSMKYDGTGDWLTAIDGPQLQIGTGDFTIDGWVYLSAISVAYGIISKGTATTGWSVNVTALNKLQFSYTASVLTGTTSLATGTWYYFAVVRSGSATGNLKIYLNGTADATSGGAVTDNFNQTSILYVGADRIGTSALNGYLQDVRITKYARTITTPTAAFPTR
jgi:hypothetical protein